MHNECLNNPDQLFNFLFAGTDREQQFPLGNHQYNLKKGVGVPVELKMAPGLKVGNRVKAKPPLFLGADEREIYLDLGPRGMKSMERLLRYWQFSLSLFLCACAFVNMALHQTKPVSLIIMQEPNVPISFYFQPVWMTL